MGVAINSFIFNSDFASEKMVDIPVIVISKSIASGSRTGRQLLGSSDATVPAGDYILSCFHSSTQNSLRYIGPYGLYFSGTADDPAFEYNTFGEVIQLSSTSIRLNVWLEVGGGGSCTVPAFTATARVRLSVLPLAW